MTTLPSTTSIRLPRPSGPMLPAPGSGMGPPVQPAGHTGMTGADVWRVIRGNLVWIILAAILGGVVGAGVYGYLLKYYPKYRSVGYVIVNKPFRISPSNKLKDEDDMDVDFNLPVEQKTQTEQLLSEGLWNDVIEKNDKVRSTDWFKTFQTEAQKNPSVTPARLAKNDLDSNLRVSPIVDSKLIEITMDCASPEDARDIVQNLVDAHIDDQRQLSQDRTSLELQSAKSWQDRYIKLEQQTRDRMNNIQGGADGASTGALSRMSFLQVELSQLIGAETKARLDAQEASGQLDAINQQIAAGNDPYQVDLIIRNDPSVMRLQSTVDELNIQIESAQITGGKSHSTTGLEAQRDAAKKMLDRAQANARSSARNQVIDSSKSAFASTKAEADSLDARIEGIKSDMGEMTAQTAEYSGLKDELDGYKELEREMSDRVAMLQNEARQQVASVSWSSLPTTPDTLSSPNAKVILPVSVMLGIALSLGIAFLREMADTSVRSPRDIAKVGPMNLLGMVSDDTDDPQLAGVPLHMAISQAPHSMIAEQMRQVRTRLQHAASLDTMRTIAITSPGPGDGKTTIASNLAVGLALNGRRILLVDANFRKPELHRLFGVANDAGLSGVLESVATLEAVTHKTQIPNLELLAAGPKPTNPTELFESPLFNDFIDRALEDYDHVIFDAGPLLVVSEAIALAPRVDGVITVVRAKKNTRGMLGRVRDTLRQTKAENLGIVLNGVKTWGGGYYARNIKTYYAYQNGQ